MNSELLKRADDKRVMWHKGIAHVPIDNTTFS